MLRLKLFIASLIISAAIGGGAYLSLFHGWSILITATVASIICTLVALYVHIKVEDDGHTRPV
jgi:CHASE2 domain-containing sensor protein